MTFEDIHLKLKPLLGNKSDLEELRQVPFTQAMEFADHHSMLQIIETSAKENTNIEEMFLKIARVS